jgi:phage terminase large subunit-like protein
MTDSLNQAALDYYQQHIAEFIETYLVNPETGRHYQLYPAEKQFIDYMFTLDADGRLLYSDLIYSCGKKGGKTEFGSLLLIVVVLLLGGVNGSGFAIANDLEQSQSRVYERCRQIIMASPLLASIAKISNDRILFTATGGTIRSLAQDYASAAGGHPVLAVFDEVWGFQSERARRIWDELVPIPTRRISARLIVSHAGFENESELLFELYSKGLQQPEVAPSLYAGDGQLTFWTHDPISPLQTESWRTDMRRKLRPSQYQRMICNQFVRSEDTFIDMALFDQCVDPLMAHRVADKSLICWAGIDASFKHDSTALALFSWDQVNQRVFICDHRIFIPTSESPINFAHAVEQSILDWHQRFSLQSVWYDPYQMVATAQALQRQGVVMVEFAQSIPNLTRLAENLHSLIKNKNILFYRDDEIRQAISRSVAEEKGRGWKITKEKQSHRIDITIAIGMAALAAVTAQENSYDYSMRWVDGIGLSAGNAATPDVDPRAYAAQQLFAHLQNGINSMNTLSYRNRRFF